MPLVAIRNSETIEAPDVSPGNWLALKGGYRDSGLTMVCGQPAIPKTSPLGLQFFAHWPSTHCQLHEGGPETPAHLAAKSAVAAAARAAGWNATIEHLAADRSWIADVLAERDGRRIAFEIQLSSQTDVNFARRQTRYEADGVECLWLVNPGNRRSAASVPHFILRGGSEPLTLDIAFSGAHSRVPIGDAIARILNGGLRPTPEELAVPRRQLAWVRRYGIPEFNARWEALLRLCRRDGAARGVDDRDWRTPYPVAEMSSAHLLAELKQAFMLLELDLIVGVSASRRREGIHDNFPELLGEFYPEPDLA